MKPLDVREYLYDIARACVLIRQFTDAKTFDEYASDPMPRCAVERQFEIIGEALNLALRVEPGLADGITETRRIVAFRNRSRGACAAFATANA